MPNVIDIGKLKGDRISSLLRSLDERISLKHVHRRLQVPNPREQRTAFAGPHHRPRSRTLIAALTGGRQGPHRDHICGGRTASAPHLQRAAAVDEDRWLGEPGAAHHTAGAHSLARSAAAPPEPVPSDPTLSSRSRRPCRSSCSSAAAFSPCCPRTARASRSSAATCFSRGACGTPSCIGSRPTGSSCWRRARSWAVCSCCSPPCRRATMTRGRPTR